jgi:hypothetical protein
MLSFVLVGVEAAIKNCRRCQRGWLVKLSNRLSKRTWVIFFTVTWGGFMFARELSTMLDNGRFTPARALFAFLVFMAAGWLSGQVSWYVIIGPYVARVVPRAARPVRPIEPIDQVSAQQPTHPYVVIQLSRMTYGEQLEIAARTLLHGVRNLVRTLVAALTVCGIVLAFVPTFREHLLSDAQSVLLRVLVFVGGCLVMITLLVLATAAVLRGAEKRLQKSPTSRLDDEGVWTQTEQGMLREVAWADIDTIAESRRAVYLMRKGRNILVFPKRFFTKESDIEWLRRRVRREQD